MKFLAFLLVCWILILASPLQAEPVPEYALDRDFTNCMGGEDAKPDPERTAYCNCVREGMRDWDLDTYGNVAIEQSKAQNPQQTAPKIEELAKGCIAKALK